ncbi:hypothetical protein AB0J86_27860 [Micromonospora sp. NPDC049559]|uniref:hypothetical protein n=1 Tax=Micromonospora sp. NPDC049559 TaxID=3155923 RepID=UPI00343B548E
MQPIPPVNTKTNHAIGNRTAIATDVLSGEVNLGAYPHRYLVLVAYRHIGGMPSLLAAVEWLEAQSWELVNLYPDDNSHRAVVRRRPAPTPPVQR